MAERKLDDQRVFILECIRLYKELPTLWNVKSKVYYDRNQKEKAYKILLHKYRERFPKASKLDLKKKLNALRTNYRKELRKYMHSVESGADSVYEPTLWYYRDMSFLNELQTEAEMEGETSINVDQNYQMLDLKEDDSNESRTSTPNPSSPLHEAVVYTEPIHHDHSPVKLAKRRIDKDEHNITYENISDNKDEYFHWAMACASDLRKMEGTQQVYAKKAIAEIIMEGQLGSLHRHSVKVNEHQMFGQTSKHLATQFGARSMYIEPAGDQYTSTEDKKPFVENPLDDNDQLTNISFLK